MIFSDLAAVCENLLEHLNIDCKNTLGGFSKDSPNIFVLQGNLGAGKTTLVKEFVKCVGLGEVATSPTYSLAHHYGDEYGGIWHYDLYTKGLENALHLGLLDMLEKNGVHFIEWGDERLCEILRNAGFEICVIEIKILPQAREYHIKY